MSKSNMPQVHHKVREEGCRVGCGACSRTQCSYRSEGSSSAFGVRTGSSNEPPGTISTFLPSPECAEIAALKPKLAEVEGERDAAIRNQSNKRPATMSSVASASADDQSSQRVERVVAGMPRGVGTSTCRRKREQSDGVNFSFVRWCSENIRIDGVMVP